MLDNKRGLSAIIITVIMIGLALAAIALVWVVVSNLINDELENASAGLSKVILDVDKVEITNDGVEVKVTRNAEAGDLEMIKFRFNNKDDSYSVDKIVELGPGDSKTYSFNFEDIKADYFSEVTIAPMLKVNEDGEPRLYDITDKYELTNKQIVSSIGAVPISWWRFEGDANDEMGKNDLIFVETGASYTEGDYGQALEIENNQFSSELKDAKIGDEYSIVLSFISESDYTNPDMFIKLRNSDNTYKRVFLITGSSPLGSALRFDDGGDSGKIISSNKYVKDSGWEVAVATAIKGVVTGQEDNLYLGGVVTPGSVDATATFNDNLNKIYLGEVGFPFEGKIDEVMIFDKALIVDEGNGINQIENLQKFMESLK